MISRSLLAWLLVFPHLDLTAAMHKIRLLNQDTAVTSYELLATEPNQISEASNRRALGSPSSKFLETIWSRGKKSTSEIDADLVAIAEDPKNMEWYYNHIFNPNPLRPEHHYTYHWLTGGELNESLDKAFCHKYISGDQIIFNLLKKFKSKQWKRPKKLSKDMKSKIDKALDNLFQMKDKSDHEPAIRMAHYIQVFCQISGIRPQERTELEKLILKHIQDQMVPKYTGEALDSHVRYLYRCMNRILGVKTPARPAHVWSSSR
ncbi:hypothetical protein PTTG_27305 [Puccinia triticina 1-1 BBBD Race 1]|uniref:Uncharacterized protein n=2 Tax=Puccinia triticina TaxID=208348 RepID=A0A180GL63_PUCT1|nr:uncharacterized protein PtA15_3A595 [Puccinia triticina]OAV93526.1 hypothetical protein PTTG_27305 [Puccinia triticina 1-1 BBBD Race 1]WAQ83226.1 hypothetical protein PtA15_3A595 [Puccinia triticina]WAR54075.1 hypothetical protein PtB15_3B585 [Puccinia triticina]